jgi:hypothetical protein
VSDAGVKALAGMNLKELSLPEKAKTDLGLKHYLAAIEPPTELDLSRYSSNWHITDAGLKEVAAQRQLRSLDLTQANISDAGLQALAGLAELRTLRLAGLSTKVTDAGMKELLALRNLQLLDLSDTQVTDAGVKELAALKNLRTLHLGGSTQVTSAGLKKLADLSQLRWLSLNGTSISDNDVKDLASFRQLLRLDVRNTKVTKSGAEELRKLLPLCRIVLKEPSAALRLGGVLPIGWSARLLRSARGAGRDTLVPLARGDGLEAGADIRLYPLQFEKELFGALEAQPPREFRLVLQPVGDLRERAVGDDAEPRFDKPEERIAHSQCLRIRGG